VHLLRKIAIQEMKQMKARKKHKQSSEREREKLLT